MASPRVSKTVSSVSTLLLFRRLFGGEIDVCDAKNDGGGKGIPATYYDSTPDVFRSHPLVRARTSTGDLPRAMCCRVDSVPARYFDKKTHVRVVLYNPGPLAFPKILLQHGLSVSAAAGGDNTALHLAAYRSHPDDVATRRLHILRVGPMYL